MLAAGGPYEQNTPRPRLGEQEKNREKPKNYQDRYVQPNRDRTSQIFHSRPNFKHILSIIASSIPPFGSSNHIPSLPLVLTRDAKIFGSFIHQAFTEHLLWASMVLGAQQ